MGKRTFKVKSWTLEIDQEDIRVETSGGIAYDPKWTFTDEAGHEHRYVDQRPYYPTLREVVDHTYWCDTCRDEHEYTHMECVVCGEHIEPGTMFEGPRTLHIPGMRTATAVYDDGRQRQLWDLTPDDLAGLEVIKGNYALLPERLEALLIGREPHEWSGTL